MSTKELETTITMLAFAQSTSGDHAKALETMRKAIAINLRNENYRFNLAHIYLAKRSRIRRWPFSSHYGRSLNPEKAAQVVAAIQIVQEFQQLRASDVGLIPPGRRGWFRRFHAG